MSDPNTTPRSNRNRGRQRHKHQSPAPHGNDAQYYSDGASARKKDQRRQHQNDFAVDTQAPSPVPSAQTPYAGPTFHASPAPSSLPMPRKYSRNTASPAQNSAPQPQILPNENAPPASPSPASRVLSSHQPAREGSPLDILFSAHRAEQARKASNSSPLAKPPLVQPELGQNRSHSQPQFLDRSARSGRRAFLAEVDGTVTEEEASDSGMQNISFKDRLTAVKTPPQHKAAALPCSHDADEQSRQEKTAALKRLLMSPPTQSGQGAGWQQTSVPEGRKTQHQDWAQSQSRVPTANNSTFDPFASLQQHYPQAWQPQQQQQHNQQSHSQQPQPSHPEAQQVPHASPVPQQPQPTAPPTDFKNMEDSLRRILKLPN